MIQNAVKNKKDLILKMLSPKQGLLYSQALNQESVTSGFNDTASWLVTSSFSLL